MNRHSPKPMTGNNTDDISAQASQGRLMGEAWRDLRDGAVNWRLWTHLGLSDIRGRYRRSRIGQNWQTISLAVLVGAIALVYSSLLNMDPRVYAVYVVCAFSCWTLMNGIVNESCSVFVSSEGIIRHYDFPKSVFIYQMIARNMVVFMHNVVLIVPVFLLTGHGFSINILFVLPALVVYAVNAVWIGAVLGMTCARFRDIPQGVASAMQIGFIVTPVMFMPTSLSGQQRLIIDVNPFARFLAIARDPLMGQVPSLADYGFVLTVTLLGCVLGFLVFARTRRKLIYWL